MTPKVIIGSLIILIIFILGIYLQKTGKPYQNVVLTVHKLLGIGSIAYISVITVRHLRTFSFDTLILISVILLVLSVVALIASGALLTLKREITGMGMVHKIATAAFLLGLIGIFYSFLKH